MDLLGGNFPCSELKERTFEKRGAFINLSHFFPHQNKETGSLHLTGAGRDSSSMKLSWNFQI